MSFKSFPIDLVPMLIAIGSFISAYLLYKSSDEKRKIYENQIKEKIQLLYMARLAFGTIIISATYFFLSIHYIYVTYYVPGIYEVDFVSVTWNALESLILVFLWQLCSMGRHFILIRLDYTLLENKLNLIEGMLSNAEGFVWQKDHCGRYQFCDPGWAQLFFGFDSVEQVLGKTDIQLLNEYRERTNKTHTFGELCVSTDDHCRAMKEKCRYIEFGHIDETYIVMDVAKTPLYTSSCKYIGTVGMAWIIKDDADAVLANIQYWTSKGRLVKVSDGAWYIKEPKDITISKLLCDLHKDIIKKPQQTKIEE